MKWIQVLDRQTELDEIQIDIGSPIKLRQAEFRSRERRLKAIKEMFVDGQYSSLEYVKAVANLMINFE